MQFATYPTHVGAGNFDSLNSFIQDRKRDSFVMPLSSLEVRDDGQLDIGGEALSMTRYAVKELSGLLKIPPSYMLKTANENAMQNFNFHLPSAAGNVQIITDSSSSGRIVVGLVKEKTQPLPLDLVVEELTAASHGLTLRSWRVDEEGLSARYISPKLKAEPRVGDFVHAGVDFLDYENSDGGLDVRGLMERLVCMNGATVPEVSFGRYIKKADWKEPAIVMETALGYFEETVRAVAVYADNLKELTEHEFVMPEDDPDKFLARPMRVLRVPKKFHEEVADAMHAEEDTFFGMYNALTRLGRDAHSRDVRFIFERAGFRTVSLLSEVQEAYELSTAEI